MFQEISHFVLSETATFERFREIRKKRPLRTEAKIQEIRPPKILGTITLLPRIYSEYHAFLPVWP